MGYIQDLERELREKLEDMNDPENHEVIKFFKEKILESYKNGIEAGKKGKVFQKPKNKSFSKAQK